MDIDLSEWLRVQLDTDARDIADPYAEKAWHARDCVMLPDGDSPTYPCDCGVPDRLLREIEAKRQIVAPYAAALTDREMLRARMREVIYKEPEEFARLHRQESELIDRASSLASVVRLLALPYADRLGYREDWRP
ncbi:DUF6221 family protein [Streptomyces sp. NPDC056738]|uniref:DUF6221 family protein n=1 Tax=Streptomyces sp. NPDC056738 TaxID=3345933 RepID=UPI003673C7FC